MAFSFWPTLKSQNISFLLDRPLSLSAAQGRGGGGARVEHELSEGQSQLHGRIYQPTAVAMPEERSRQERNENNDTDDGRTYRLMDSLCCLEMARL